MCPPNELDKKNKILKAAVEVFSEKGFHSAKVDEIAQLADVGKGTVYEYFASKKELFQEMFKVGMKFYVDQLRRDINPEIPAREKLLRIARLHVRFVHKYKDLARITMTEHAYFDEEFRNWIKESRQEKLDLLKKIIEQGISDQEFRQIEPSVAALSFMGSLGAIFPVLVIDENEIELDDYINKIMDIYFNGILNH